MLCITSPNQAVLPSGLLYTFGSHEFADAASSENVTYVVLTAAYFLRYLQSHSKFDDSYACGSFHICSVTPYYLVEGLLVVFTATYAHIINSGTL